MLWVVGVEDRQTQARHVHDYGKHTHTHTPTTDGSIKKTNHGRIKI